MYQENPTEGECRRFFGLARILRGGPNGDFFAPPIQAPEKLLVPTISLYEVFKRVLQQCGEGDALQAVALMSRV